MNARALYIAGALCFLMVGCAASPERSMPARHATVSTFAGSGTAGTQNGVGAGAQLNRPHGMSIASDGTLYVSDRGNHQIRAIAANGAVRTVAGSTQGYRDGAGGQAQFFEPVAVVVDRAGVLYVADRNNHRIRRITSDGNVITVAGTGTAGFNEGPANGAMFNTPYGVALDASERFLYVADYLNHAIRRIDLSSGVVSTIAGNGTAGNADGTGAAARFNQPYNVKIDRAGNLWVPDQLNHAIRKVTPTGVVTTLAGNGKEGFADGAGSGAQFNNPTGLTPTADGSVIVADRNNHRVRRAAADGTVTTVAGDGKGAFADGPLSSAQFNRPIDVVEDRRTGALYVSEENNHRVRRIGE
jgi:sugar lactone lactonase YvrE